MTLYGAWGKQPGFPVRFSGGVEGGRGGGHPARMFLWRVYVTGVT